MRIDAVFRNARIRTMDPDRPQARALAVWGGRVVALDEAAEDLAPVAGTVVDLRGQPILPGFNDVHHHLSLRGLRQRSVDLRPQTVATLHALYETVGSAASRAGGGEWVHGSGYDQNKLGGHPVASRLDRVAPDNPVWLEHISGHMGVANTAALERAGFPGREGVPDVDGGQVAREGDAPDARAAGLLQERAMDIIMSVYKPLPIENVVDNLAAASRTALSEGITSITEPGVGTVRGIGNTPLDLHAYLTAHERGLLGVRAQVMPYITTLGEVTAGVDTGWGLDLGVRTGLGDEWVRIGPVKVLTDGSLIGRSAAMTHSYHGEDHSGFMAWEPKQLEEMLQGAHRLGFRLSAHAIGDRAVEHVLDIYERILGQWPRPDVRHRIEHFAVASDEQVARTGRLGLVPVPQGRFISELGDGVIEAVGPERLPLTYRFGSLLGAGLEVPGSSDSPVVEAAPILGIHDLVNRKTANGADFVPGERVTAEQAVRAYTVGSAYASCEEDIKGTLTVGKLADFTVLSDDLLAVAPDRIDTVQVGATVVGGRVAFDDNAIGPA